MSLASVPRYDADRHTGRGGHAVVVGAGVAGLLAARVLADRFADVTVLEGDPAPDGPVARSGVPQARHVHVMLEAGRATLEALCPGYRGELLAAGGLEIDGARDVAFYAEGDFLADGPTPMPQYAGTRPLYEWILRNRVDGLDGVRIRSGHRVTDYRADAGRVTGVAIRGGKRSRLDADLVVDATGRTSRTPAWLADHGYASPPVDEVRIDLAYSTTFVRRPPDDRRAFVVTPDPSCPRAASVLPVEGDRWIVTVGGVHGDHPPTDRPGLVDFAAELPIPHVERMLETRAWVGEEVTHYPFPTNRRHRYERLDRFPDGLLVVGDAVASFNPLYAQGMSVAALEALVLHRALATTDGDDLAPTVFGRNAAVVDVAWRLAVGADCRFPATTGPRPRGSGLASRYLSRLTRRARTDGHLRAALFRVLSMEHPPSSLFRPRVLWRVLAPGRRHTG
jgi:2-polyprenyl-6-methoxyphenol hydroxylase-like FAD-dependent oxidoreductase